MVTYRDEEVRDATLILEPSIAILSAAALNVTQSAVGNHEAEEDGVEPREGAPVMD